MSEDDKSYSQEIQDRIRELAHAMWESAGRLHGLATEYWLAAEKEVLATMRVAAERLTSGEKPEKAEEPEAETAPAAAAPATAPETVGTEGKPASGTVQAEQPKSARAKSKKM